MTLFPGRSPAWPAGLTAALVALVMALSATSVSAQTAQVRYTRAQAKEAAARSAKAPSLASLRAIAAAYEQIPRRYPRSAYSDNALWQAAGVMQLAYERGHVAKDRDKAAQLLSWLKKEYPRSALVKEVAARVAALHPPATKSAVPIPATKPATPPAVELAAAVTPAAPLAPAPTPIPPPKAAPAAVGAKAAAPSRDTTPAVVTSVPLTPLPEPVIPVSRPPAPRPAESSATLPAVAADSAAVSVRSIAYTKLPRGDRLTIELSHEATFTTRQSALPATLAVTLPGVGAPATVAGAATSMRGKYINAVAMERRDGTLNVNIRLAGRPRYSTFPLYDPYRLVIDLEDEVPVASVEPTSVATPTQTSWTATPAAAPPSLEPPASPKPDSPSSTSRGDFSLARQLGLGVSRIVIDPGHGGHDPGAEANSVTEAGLVLDVALRLEKLLKAQPGFEVALTRRTDQYVALEERTAIANRENADLFLSIHANSSPNKDTRGIETYFLNFANSASAEAVAARENASSAQAMHILPEIVKAIATSDKVAESRELAGFVQTSLMRRVGTLNRSIKDLGVKQAPFVVLIGARMPSVLAEISFLSNKTEAGLLQQASHRDRIAQALCDAILKYQSSLKKVTTVADRQ